MNIFGIILIIVGIIMTGGAAGSGYGLVAPVTMFGLVLAGVAMLLKGKADRMTVGGMFVAWFGLVLVAGSAAGNYGLAAPITMSLVVLAGIVMMFWQKLKPLFGGSGKPPAPPSTPAQPQK